MSPAVLAFLWEDESREATRAGTGSLVSTHQTSAERRCQLGGKKPHQKLQFAREKNNTSLVVAQRVTEPGRMPRSRWKGDRIRK